MAGQVIRNKNWAWTSVINGSHVKDRIKQISDKLKNTAYQLEEDNPLKLRFREGGSQYDIYAVRSAGSDPATIRMIGWPGASYDRYDDDGVTIPAE